LNLIIHAVDTVRAILQQPLGIKRGRRFRCRHRIDDIASLTPAALLIGCGRNKKKGKRCRHGGENETSASASTLTTTPLCQQMRTFELRRREAFIFYFILPIPFSEPKTNKKCIDKSAERHLLLRLTQKYQRSIVISFHEPRQRR